MSDFFEVVGIVFSAASLVLCFSVYFGVVQFVFHDDEDE